MNRNVKTILLALFVVGGLWVLVNQEQIHEAGGVSAYLSALAEQATVDGPTANSPTSNGPMANRPMSNGQWVNSAASNFDRNWQSTPLRDQTIFRNMAGNVDRQQPQPFQLPRDTQERSYLLANTGLPPRRADTIRIASFKMNVGVDMSAQPGTLSLMSSLCSQFDVIAFQEINSQNARWLETLGQNVAKQSNGSIQFRAISDQSRIAPGAPQFTILYNAQTLELDFAHWYSVNDPDGLLQREPLVGWFRTRNVPTEQAFTFTLANIQLDNRRPDLELAYVDDLFRAIRQDGRGEDDVIITGNFNAGDRGLTALRQRAGLTWVVYDTATTTDKDSQFDNLVFSQNASVEFTGLGGVFDFLAAYNLPLDYAKSISTHMPVWAEFSVNEGRFTPAAPRIPSAAE